MGSIQNARQFMYKAYRLARLGELLYHDNPTDTRIFYNDRRKKWRRECVEILADMSNYIHAILIRGTTLEQDESTTVGD